MAVQYSFGQIVTSGLVLALDAADRNSYPGSGTTWTDLSGNNNTGSLTNGPTFNSTNGGSIVFDGTNDYVNLGDPSSLSITDNLSVNVWFNISLLGDWRGIVAKRGSGGTTNYGINYNSTLDLFQWYYNTSGIYRITSVSFSANFTTGIWYNVCGTFAKNNTNTNCVLYKNGVSIVSNTLSNNIITVATPLTVGSTTTSAEFFGGTIASVQIYNRALSATEILQNYNAQKSRFNL